MARVKTARITRKKHKKVLKQAKGYFGAKSYRFRNANQAVLKSLSYAYVGRKDKKSNFRKLWITRINAAARMNGLTYSQLINGLKKAAVPASVTINAITFRWKCWRSAARSWSRRPIVSEFLSRSARTPTKNAWRRLSTKICSLILPRKSPAQRQ